MDARTEQLYALAALFQYASEVNALAVHGEHQEQILASATGSLFAFDPPDTASVFGGLEGVQNGLSILVDHFGGLDPCPPAIIRYVFKVLLLERRVSSQHALMRALGNELRQLTPLFERAGPTSPELLGEVARIYRRSISPAGPPIQVTGERRFLEHEPTADRVRTLLFAGFRAAVVWRQRGGQRWQLGLMPRRYARAAARLLDTPVDV